jgi:hypothetical protein
MSLLSARLAASVARNLPRTASQVCGFESGQFASSIIVKTSILFGEKKSMSAEVERAIKNRPFFLT